LCTRVSSVAITTSYYSLQQCLVFRHLSVVWVHRVWRVIQVNRDISAVVVAFIARSRDDARCRQPESHSNVRMLQLESSTLDIDSAFSNFAGILEGERMTIKNAATTSDIKAARKKHSLWVSRINCNEEYNCTYNSRMKNDHPTAG